MPFAPTDDSIRCLDEELARNRVKASLLGVPNSSVRLGRFKVLRVLGRGGMGKVFEAFDPELNQHVALKTLHKVDAVGVDRFKREFRALADVTHPVLVNFHSLFCEAGLWYFSMDLAHGVPFTDAVRDRQGRLDVYRLRETLAQIGQGLSALHGAGKLHQDIKPPNILVSESGKVTILDFGLVRDHDLNASESLEAGAVGTPGFVAPELILDRPPSAAADFYGVGVMLYEVLTGKLPFGAGVGDLFARTHRDPSPPSLLASDVPPDLEALCLRLLTRDPRLRAGAAELVALAGAEPARQPRRRKRSPFPAPPIGFRGRRQELGVLADAYRETMAGRPACVLVTGPAQSGKSSLAHYFASCCPDDAVVLRGRSRPAEHLPCEVFDGLTDSLGAYLRRCHDDVYMLLPRHIHDLVKLFPVLGRVPEVAETPPARVGAVSPAELRARAHGAFRELLQRLSDRHPVVLLVEDLRWAEADSAAMLHAMISGPDPAPVLFIGTCASEGLPQSPFVRTLLELTEGTNQTPRILELTPYHAQ